MNLFKIADESKKVADSKKRGNQSALKTTISIPYFKGLYRKKGNLTGAFLISYFTCLAFCIVKAENAHRTFSNSIRPDTEDAMPSVHLSTYLIEALLNQEGFSLAEYQQGKTQGAKRIEQHLKAIAEKEEMSFSVNEQGVVKGVTPKVAQSVLSAI